MPGGTTTTRYFSACFIADAEQIPADLPADRSVNLSKTEARERIRADAISGRARGIIVHAYSYEQN